MARHPILTAALRLSMPRCWLIDQGGNHDSCHTVWSHLSAGEPLECLGIEDEFFTQNMAKLLFGSEMHIWKGHAKHFDGLITKENATSTAAKLDWYYPYDLHEVASELSCTAMLDVADKLESSCVCVTNDKPGWGRGPYTHYLRALEDASPRICSTSALDLAVKTRASAPGMQVRSPNRMPRCVFIVGVGRSATSSLVKYLNTNLDDCMLYGENQAFMQHLRHFTEQHVRPLYESSDDAAHFARTLFRGFYNRSGHECVGFKEIRFGADSYDEFERDMRFLQSMCDKTQIILHYAEDIQRSIDSQVGHGWMTEEAAIHKVENHVDNFKRFYEEHPTECFLSTMETTLTDPAPMMAYLGKDDAPPFEVHD